MAQLKDSLITGDLRVTGKIYGLGTGLTNIDASQITSGTLSVERGGTGQTSVANIQAGKDSSGNTITSTYVKKAGDTMTGALNFANNTYNKMGDDCQIGDQNQAGKIALKGINGATGIYFAPYSGSTAQTLSIDGAGTATLTGSLSIGSALTVGNRLTMTSGKPINQILTGTGTAAADAGSGNSPRYTPAKWTYNTGANASNGDIFTIKIPVAGHNWGVYISVNNGTNYYPLVHQGTNRVTTHYPSGYIIQVIFDSSGSAASMTPVAGADSVNGSTITGGVFRILNYYADGNNYNWVRPYYVYWKTRALLGRYQLVFTQDEQYLLSPCAVDNNTGTSKTMTTLEFDPFGDIYYYQAGSSVTAGNKIGDNNLMSTNGLIDLRYSFNITTSTFTSQKGVYLVMVPQTNGKVKLHSSPLTQTLPTTSDGLLYKYLGQAYDGYRIQLIQEKPVYYFSNGSLKLWTGTDENLTFASASTITGDGSTTAFAVSHTFNTRDVLVSVYDLSTYSTIECDVTRTSASSVTVTFGSAPASGTSYRVIISSTVVNNDSLTFANAVTITGNGSSTTFTATHTLNTKDVIVQVYDLSTYETVGCDITRTDNSTITIEFATAPASGKTYRVVISSITMRSISG